MLEDLSYYFVWISFTWLSMNPIIIPLIGNLMYHFLIHICVILSNLSLNHHDFVLGLFSQKVL